MKRSTDALDDTAAGRTLASQIEFESSCIERRRDTIRGPQQ